MRASESASHSCTDGGEFEGTTLPSPARETAADTSAPVLERISSPGSSTPPAPVLGSPGLSALVPKSTRPMTRLQRGIRKTKTYTDGSIRYGLLTSTGEPEDLDEALHNKYWKDAMFFEYEALMKNNTWHLVPPKKGSNIKGCKWVYKIKRKLDCSLDRYKARLVAKEFKQRYVID